jgi:hypothetical protein
MESCWVTSSMLAKIPEKVTARGLESCAARARRSYDSDAMTPEPRSRLFVEFGCALLLDIVCIGVTGVILWLSHRGARAATVRTPDAAPR